MSIDPFTIKGARQKGAFLEGMREFHRAPVGKGCPWNHPMMFKYWMAGRYYAHDNPGLDCTKPKGFKDVFPKQEASQ